MFKKSFHLLASLKVAIPLLVLLTAVTIVASLFPDPDLFKTWWYLGLLGVLGLSLLFVTILHAPSILKRKGRNALIGVITTHLGILVLIAGIIYGGFSGFRYEIKLVEGEIKVVPGLPFVIRLDELLIEEYRQEDFPRMSLDKLPKKKQDSHITLLKSGKPFSSAVAAPGSPVNVDGITLLPSVSDTGWYFELITIDPQGREKTIPVRPWSPPLITLGNQRLMTHSVVTREFQEAELFTIEKDKVVSLGFARAGQTLVIEGHSVSLGPVRRYTGMKVYNRPQEWVLVLGCILMFAGLVWHFYFRHRGRKQGGDIENA
ncbi:MAG: cytochrome c biogenesis protein ResB [Planctomycetota bacterium]